MRFAAASLIAFVGVASAASGCSQAPSSGDPSGNPIAAPGLNQVVPAGTPFTITWNVSVSCIIQCASRSRIILTPLFSPQRPAVCPLSFFVVLQPMSCPLDVSSTTSPTTANSSGPHLQLLLLIQPTTASRSSPLAPGNTNTQPNSASPTLSAP